MKAVFSKRRTAAMLALTAGLFTAGAAVADPCDGAKSGMAVVKFETGSTAINAEDQKRIKNFASRSLRSPRICLLGQADAQGDESANRRLAEARVEKVRRQLIASGARADRIETHIQDKQFTLFGLLDEDQANDRRVLMGYQRD
ncbi:MAG: OmpA family protein [Pseudomonadota bacterium]